MNLRSTSKLLLLHILIRSALCSHPFSGQTIKELSTGFYTELQSDFGSPLKEDEAESLWIQAMEDYWTVMKKRPTEIFPFLVCNSQQGMSTYDQLRSVSRVLERAASTSGHPCKYFNQYSDEMSLYPDSITKIAIEPLLTRVESSCFLTSMSYNTAVLVDSDLDSKYISFNPMTPSMKMVEGTVQTLKSVLSGSYFDIPSPSIVLDRCPHVTNTFTKNVLAKNIATYLKKSNSASQISYTTKSNFFHKMVSEKENAVLPDRFTFWHENLENGVENASTENCKSFLERIVVSKGDTHSFKLDVNLREATDTEKSCFWSMVAGIGEMPSICLLEIHFPTEKA
eukprot:CAMPEP_0172429958 /NCGR_PEP_ID=MMETSP1064-20121228/52570_1 /TAXON_ID=202472 /ORGANISM="Aulacoseira subarctica , Strain CCAP 1002/5" /LENGTH=339 /DNA_ID=CAMNT_0013175705 /DNA_START=45 /DNA_END=1064 /DNA_ORIENTATION=-